MKKGIMVVLFSSILLLMLIVACAAPAQKPVSPPESKQGEPITIGLLSPTKMAMGVAQVRGAEMAVEEINAAGGVSISGVKHQLKLVIEDTNEFVSIPDATAAAQKLITREKPFMVMGVIRSEIAPTVMDLCADNKILFFSCGTTSMKLTEMVKSNYDKYKYWFRIMPINTVYCAQTLEPFLNYGGQVCREAYGLKPDETLDVAVVIEKGEAGDLMTQMVTASLPKINMKAVGTWRPASTATDLTGELSAIKTAKAQMIAGWLFSQVGVPFARQWGELEIPAPYFGMHGSMGGKSFWDATVGKGNYITSTQQTWARVAITPKTIPFWDKYNAKYNDFPMATAMAYDVIYIFKEATEKANSLNADSIVSVMEKSEFVTAAGKQKWCGMNEQYPHDSYFAIGYGSTQMGTQWVNNEYRCIWPWNYQGVTYEGTKKAEVAPWAVQFWKKELGK